MKKLSYALLAFVAILAGAAAVVYNTAAGQDALFRRGALAVMGQAPAPLDGMRVLVCGSASPLGNDPARAQACIAVITPEHFFLFDVGARSPLRMAQARLPMGRLNGVFLTHFHSDHIAALPDVNLASWVQGRRTPLPVHGPTGVELVVGGFNQAYQLDRGYRVAHHGPELLPAGAGPMQAMPFRADEIVWQDELLAVRAFAVEHPPIEPAVGYRVDYQGRSVVISGDSNAADNLFAAAQDADLLLHDALSRALLDPMIEAATALDLTRQPRIMTDVIDYHADSRSLPDRARNAGIRQLAYYHLVPAPANALAERMFLRDVTDDVILVRDLHTFDLPPNSSAIHITEP